MSFFRLKKGLTPEICTLCINYHIQLAFLLTFHVFGSSACCSGNGTQRSDRCAPKRPFGAATNTTSRKGEGNSLAHSSAGFIPWWWRVFHSFLAIDYADQKTTTEDRTLEATVGLERSLFGHLIITVCSKIQKTRYEDDLQIIFSRTGWALCSIISSTVRPSLLIDHYYLF